MATSFFRGLTDAFGPAFEQSRTSGRRFRERNEFREIQAEARQVASDERQQRFFSSTLQGLLKLPEAERTQAFEVLRPGLAAQGIPADRLDQVGESLSAFEARTKERRAALTRRLEGPPTLPGAPTTGGPPPEAGLSQLNDVVTQLQGTRRAAIGGGTLPGPQLQQAPAVAQQVRPQAPAQAVAPRLPPTPEVELRRLERIQRDPNLTAEGRERVDLRIRQVTAQTERERDLRRFQTKQEVEASNNLFDIRSRARAGIRGEKVYQNFVGAQQAFNIIRQGALSRNNVGDLALVSGFARMLDPNSVVRPSESATVQASQGAVDRLKVLLPQVQAGERLTDAQRDRLFNLAEKIFGEYAAQVRGQLRPVYTAILAGTGVTAASVLGPLNITNRPGAPADLAPGGQSGSAGAAPLTPQQRTDMQELLQDATPAQRRRLRPGR